MFGNDRVTDAMVRVVRFGSHVVEHEVAKHFIPNPSHVPMNKAAQKEGELEDALRQYHEVLGHRIRVLGPENLTVP
jgi:hypothetical protein